MKRASKRERERREEKEELKRNKKNLNFWSLVMAGKRFHFRTYKIVCECSPHFQVLLEFFSSLSFSHSLFFFFSSTLPHSPRDRCFGWLSSRPMVCGVPAKPTDSEICCLLAFFRQYTYMLRFLFFFWRRNVDGFSNLGNWLINSHIVALNEWAERARRR